MSEELDWTSLFEEMKELGIKPDAPRLSNAVTQDTRLRESFKEINNFVRKEGRIPEASKGMIERALRKRLSEFRTNPEKATAVRDLDEFSLLPQDVSQEDDSIWSNISQLIPCNDICRDIFDTGKLLQRRSQPDYIATRKQCKDFERFMPLFAQCHEDLENKHRHIIRLAGSHAQQSITSGCFVLIGRLLAYVAGANDAFVQGDRTNSRLRIIFENGRECDMLYRSLLTALYKDGALISKYDEEELVMCAEEECENESLESCGIIYILRSASEKSEIRAIPNLFKIGVTTTDVENRIRNARNEATYLMDDVKIVQTFTCYNINVHKLETLIHRFFDTCKVELDVVDKGGYICHPREWYSVPISVIQQAVSMIIDGSIVNYRYDRSTQRIRPKRED
ncbi:MAG: GIY-YIG nuclease family protein [Akkermansia sp.]|nr:GIY-YIG nuclease family protein [Akkermansia sp.]